MKKVYLVTIIVLLSLNFQQSFGQIVINEISAANSAEIASPDGDFNDWIELYNAGSNTVDLSGYSISDDPSDPLKFLIRSGTIEAGKHQLIFANGNDNGYKVNHWELAVDADDDWRYYSGSSQPDTNWRNRSFNESVWQRDNGGFGFGDGDDNTTISQTKAVFFRRTFTVNDPSDIVCAVLNMDYDDGFIAYLNGVEIGRSKMGSPLRRYGNDVYSSGSHEALMYRGLDPEYFYVSPQKLADLLVPGNNVLAVQVHNETSGSNDLTAKAYLAFGMKNSGVQYSNVHSWFEHDNYDIYEASFKLDRHGEDVYLYDNSGSLIDHQSYANMQEDNSAGRKPDGGGWGIFSNPTPGSSNNGSTLYNNYCPKPVFSHPAGFYTSNISLAITSPLSGATIRYTTDGTDPSSSSSVWNNNLSINSTKVVKARIYKSGYLPGDIVTNTYFKNQSLDLPVITINTDPDNLFDNNTGIYQLGPNADPAYPNFGANFWQDWERPATVEYFDRNDDQLFNVKADIKIYGNYSRAKPQKSFEIKVNENTGYGAIDYPLIPDKPTLPEFDNFVLRNSGSDWNEVHFRDAFLQRVLKPSHTGYLATQPVNVYINGSYWGVYCIYENHDQHFMKNNYGYHKDEIDYLIEGGSIDTKYGSKADFMNLVSYATSANSSTTAYYDKINAELDLENFTDYMAAETYFNNQDWMGDWTNNIKMWRPQGGKWRYLIYDLDMTVGYSGASSSGNTLKLARDPNSQNYTSDLFDAILENPTYKNYFINRYADLINTIFLPDSMKKIEKTFKDSMANDMVKHFNKWGGSTSAWNSDISSMESFINARPAKMRGFIQSEMGLNSQVTLTLNVSPAGAGKILISTVIPKSYPWSGVYFKGNPVTITAIANPGYSFDHWHSNVAFTTNNTNVSVNKNFTATDAITAYFSGSAVAPPITISEINYNSNPSFNSGDWIELHNPSASTIDLSGWTIKDADDNNGFVFPVTTILPANGYLVVTQDNQLFSTQFPSVNNYIGPTPFSLSSSGDQIRLFDSNNNLVINMTYDDHLPWSEEADGDGYTLESTGPGGNLSDPVHWFAGCMGGTPGREYSALNTSVSLTGNSSICEGDTVLLEATSNGNYSYQWLNYGTPVVGANSFDFEVTETGDYSVLVSEQGCSLESNPVSINVTPVCSPPIVHDAFVCDSGQVSISAVSNAIVHWYTSDTSPNPFLTDTVFTTPVLTQSTTYFVDAGTTCPSSRIPVTVSVASSPVIFIGNDTIVNSGATVTLHAGTGFTDYLWSDGSTTESIQVQSPADMWVTVTDSSGCAGSDTISISSPTSIDDFSSSGVLIYPNPVHDKLYYKVNLGSDASMLVELFDVQGRRIVQSKINGRGFVKGEIDVTAFAKGSYILSFISENETKRVRVQIEN